jgi:hypothetical protein
VAVIGAAIMAYFLRLKPNLNAFHAEPEGESRVNAVAGCNKRSNGFCRAGFFPLKRARDKT